MFKKLLWLAAGLMLSVACLAQDSSLRSDHPDEYVVQKGDTLWDVSARFLEKPWLWPEIWHANEQIENPHLIYPGDVISLVYIDGEPRLTVNEERDSSPAQSGRMSPRVRDRGADDAIPTFDMSRLAPFIKQSYLLDEKEMENLAYVVAVENQQIVGTPGDNLYVRRLEDAELGQQYAIVRKGVAYYNVPPTMAKPWKRQPEKIREEDWGVGSGTSMSDVGDTIWKEFVHRSYFNNAELIGYEVREIGRAEVRAVGDPATLRITASRQELGEGDLLLPVSTTPVPDSFPLSLPASLPDNTRVLAISDAVRFGVIDSVVAINKGFNDGVDVGNVMTIMRPGQTIRDEVGHPRGRFRNPFDGDANVTLPDEYVGQLVVFRSFGEISYAVVVRATSGVQIMDKLVAPERLP